MPKKVKRSKTKKKLDSVSRRVKAIPNKLVIQFPNGVEQIDRKKLMMVSVDNLEESAEAMAYKNHQFGSVLAAIKRQLAEAERRHAVIYGELYDRYYDRQKHSEGCTVKAVIESEIYKDPRYVAIDNEKIQLRYHKEILEGLLESLKTKSIMVSLLLNVREAEIRSMKG